LDIGGWKLAGGVANKRKILVAAFGGIESL